MGRGKSGKIEKKISFPYLCLVGKVEKWKDGKLFYLVKMKNVRIENRVCINLP